MSPRSVARDLSPSNNSAVPRNFTPFTWLKIDPSSFSCTRAGKMLIILWPRALARSNPFPSEPEEGMALPPAASITLSKFRLDLSFSFITKPLSFGKSLSTKASVIIFTPDSSSSYRRTSRILAAWSDMGNTLPWSSTLWLMPRTSKNSIVAWAGKLAKALWAKLGFSPKYESTEQFILVKLHRPLPVASSFLPTLGFLSSMVTWAP